MNFKTTIVLLVVLVLVGVIVYVAREPEGTQTETATQARLLDVSSGDITRIAFTGDDGQRTVLERADGKWRLIEPVKAPADDMDAGSLADALASLESRSQIEPGAGTGLDAPRFKVELTTKDNRTIKLDIGSRSAAGDNLYVRREGQAQADVVSANLLDQLDKPLKDWRRERLLDVASSDIKQVRIATTQQSYELAKQGDDWKVVRPTSMPADNTAVSDITMAISNLRAADFVSPATTAEDPKRYGLDQPVVSVAFSAEAPSTQPAATQPTFTMIQFGRFDDVLKKNVFATVSTEPGVVKVAATTLDEFRKTPLNLRDKKVVSIDPDHVTKITISTDKPATTQPTTREAVKQTVAIERARRVVGQPAPTTAPTTTATTAPATGPATTQASTQPIEPPAKWNLASMGGADADDAKVDQLLTELNPLRAEKYIESPAPTTQPVSTYVVTIETTDAQHEIRFTDPGGTGPVTGTYDGLNFEVARFVLEKLEGDFAKKLLPQPPPLPANPGE